MATARKRIKPNCLATILATIILLATCAGCSGPYTGDYAEFHSIDNRGWAYGDTLRYTPVYTDSIINGPLLLSVCHDDDYVYANLWVELSYRRNDPSRSWQKDTINLQLANRYGQWYGQGFGTSFQTSDTAIADYTLRRGDTLLLRHIMRVDTVSNITQVGLTLSATKN